MLDTLYVCAGPDCCSFRLWLLAEILLSVQGTVDQRLSSLESNLQVSR